MQKTSRPAVMAALTGGQTGGGSAENEEGQFGDVNEEDMQGGGGTEEDARDGVSWRQIITMSW